ncbi:MAG: ABC transporter permease [Candidatus Acidiferrales bacterium]
MGEREPAKTADREIDAGHFLETLWQDARYGARTLRRWPGFTIVAVLTLALGIGANTAIFSVVNAVLLRPLPFRDPGRLCLVTESLPSFPIVGPSYENYEDFRDQAKSFEGIAAVHIDFMNMTGRGEPQRLRTEMATSSLFPLLGVNAVQGHTFTKDEDRYGGPHVVLLSYGFWQSTFGGATNIVGKSITLDDQAYTVTGVLPPRFQLIVPAEAFVPFAPWAHGLPDDRNWHPGITAIGRLRADVSLEQARAEMATIAQRLVKQYPTYDAEMGANVNAFQDQLVQNVRPALLVLLGAVALVLLIACGNIANLLLARATARHREIAVRKAMGAGRGRIVRQLVTESVLLAILGAGVGLILAELMMAPLLSLASKSLPDVGTIGIDGTVLAFTAVVAIAAGVLFGLAPALQTSKMDIRPALSDASRGSTAGASRHRVRNVLIVAEVALALMLLIGAGLLIRSFARLQRVQPGFDPSGLLVTDVPLSPKAYAKSAQRAEFFDRIIQRARNLPGVLSAGAATVLPVTGRGSVIHFNIQGRPPKTPNDYILIGLRPVSPGYLETLRIPLVAGRLLQESDTEASPFVAVVNESMAKQYFPGQSPLGKMVQLGALPDKDVPWMRIVGVVGDVKQSLATESAAEMYVLYRQSDTLLPVFTMSLVLRTLSRPQGEAAAVRSAVHELDPNQPLVNFRTMQENMATSVSDPRFQTMLLGIFAGIAVLLAMIGLYGLMAYSVAQRTSEIGIRLALGAQRDDVMKMIVGNGLKLVLIGVGVGVAGGFALSQVLKRFLYGVVPTDPATFVTVSALLMIVAIAACYVPGRRAMNVDPLVALRHE